MLSRFEPNVNATISFLRLLGVKVNSVTVNETLQNHPDWPSLLCISDSFRKWNIPNAAGRVKSEDIDQLPVPFFACTPDHINEVAVVTKVTATHVQHFVSGRSKSINLEKDVFLKRWNGVFLIAEPNENSGEKNYDKVRRKILLQFLVPFILLFLLFSYSFLWLQSNFGANEFLAIYVQFGVYLSGIITTSLLLWYEMDRNNPLLKKICTRISKMSCEAILTGPHSKLWGLLSWSEIGFIYFNGSLLSLLFVPRSINILSLLTLLAMPYIIFSIYYQWRVAKRWCILCLTVQALLMINAATTLAMPLFLPINYSDGILVKTIGCFLFPTLLWYSIKPYCLRLQQSNTTKREYLRIKFNSEIFNTLLRKQKDITHDVSNLGIVLGKKDAKFTLIKVCNPYCDPCARAHPIIDKLLEEHSNLQVKIIFSIPSQDSESYAKPVRHLMAIEEKQNEQQIKNALDDWYLNEKKDYNVFSGKYPMNGELQEQDRKLEAMATWCRRMGVAATPTFYFNGYQLPDVYNIEDLEYFLLE